MAHKFDRRDFIKHTTAAAGAFAFGGITNLGFGQSAAESSTTQRSNESVGTKAPFKLLYNNDATNVVNRISPWYSFSMPFSENLLVKSIEEVAGHGVDAYMLSPGMGWVPWWQSKVEPNFFDWWRQRTGLEIIGRRGTESYIAAGGDMVKVLVETCRRTKMAPFVSLRVNDVHWQENYNLKNQQSLVSCRLYVEHPEWHIDPEHPKIAGYYSRRGMNFAVPEVREYKLKLIRELFANYDIAGLELDFLRDNTLFRNDVPFKERIEIITGFVSEIRKIMDQAKGRRYLCARVPANLSAFAQTGLDPKRLRQAGVDMFNMSQWIDTCQFSDLPQVRELVPDAAIYMEMTNVCGKLPSLPFVNYGLPSPRTSDYLYCTTAEMAIKNGADGMSLFNFVYTRRGNKEDHACYEPPFHVLDKLVDPAELQLQPKHYVLSDSHYYKPVPSKLEPGKAQQFQINMLKPAAKLAPTEHGRLRIHLLKPGSPDDKLTVTFNGKELVPTKDVSRLFGYIDDDRLSQPSHRRAWILPPEIIGEGTNKFSVTCSSQATISWIDCGMPGPDLS